MLVGQRVTRWGAIGAAGLALQSLGCAKAPSGGGSGVRLVVTMRMNGQINNNYHYFFLMRNAGDDIGRNGPVPVIDVPYGGNGFAAGKLPSTTDAAFTDFVHYSSNQPVVTSSGYSLYHVAGGISGRTDLVTSFQWNGEPVSTQPPGTGNILQFEVDLGQIAPATGEPAPNPDTRPRYIQVNFITTTTLPANSSIIDTNFYTDAMGDQSQGIGSASFNTYLTIDTSQIGRIYQSTVAPSPEEPTGDTWRNDVDPGIDIVQWSIQVVGR